MPLAAFYSAVLGGTADARGRHLSGPDRPTNLTTAQPDSRPFCSRRSVFRRPVSTPWWVADAQARSGAAPPARCGGDLRPMGQCGAIGSVLPVRLDLLTPGIEVGLVTTNLDAMVAFYESFLELEFQGEVQFPGGSQRRYSLGSGVVKLVTYDPPPPVPAAPGGGRAQAGVRYFTIGLNNLCAVAEALGDSEYEVAEPLTEFAPVPGMGWMFVADPDGNWIELFGTL